MASAYFAQYPVDPLDLLDITIKNHGNGALNPKAHFQHTIAQVMEKARRKLLDKGQPDPGWRDECDFLRDERSNPLIAAPLRLYDCAPISDGAACVLLAAEETANSLCSTPLHVIGSGQASGGALHSRASLTSIAAARLAASEAYEMAGVQPDDIRLAEVHDCFTIAEAIALEDLGLCAPGSGLDAAADGWSGRAGSVPINSSGGLKAKGHPVGASGVAQVVEIWLQLHGEAGARQVPRAPHLALTHNVGGTGQTCTVHIFERR
jgi:acetyl-CoA C-acetyltransferase